MPLRLRTVVLDALDASGLAAFWADALGREARKIGDGPYTVLRDPERTDPRLLIQKVPEEKSVKNRMHIDLWSTEAESEIERLVSLGASILERHSEEEGEWTVLTDPEGNEFCVIPVSPKDLE